MLWRPRCSAFLGNIQSGVFDVGDFQGTCVHAEVPNQTSYVQNSPNTQINILQVF